MTIDAIDAIDALADLARLVEEERGALLAEWRAQVRGLPAAKHLDTPTLNDHIPHLLDELASALRSGSSETIAEALLDGSPPAHGLQRVQDAFDIEEVVAEYNILRGCVHDLAERNGLSMQGRPFHVLNRVLDGAIGSAVQSFATQQALEVRHRREEYLSFLAHDLRTPLNAISLCARLLEPVLSGDRAEAPQAQQMWKALNRNVRHVQALVGKVLEESTNLETVVGVQVERRQLDLWPLVEALIHDLRPVAGGTGTTRLTNAIAEDCVVYADAGLLRRVLQNLLANAIAYTPRGEVIVGARPASGGGATECFVRDDGEGISEDACKTVFDKRDADPEKEGGLGLGLAIVKTFVEAHEGTVAVESEVGVGTTFRFTLPEPQGAPHRLTD